MTQDEIIEMAERAGMFFRSTEEQFANPNTDGVFLATLKTFAKLAAAKERDACAKLCDDVTWEGPFKSAAIAMSNRIRARGQE